MAEKLLGAALVCAVLLFSAVAGCSWTYVDAPPEVVRPGEPIECTESRAAPFADAVLAGIGVVTSLSGVTWWALVGSHGTGDESGPSNMVGLAIGLPLILGGLAITIPYAISADSGFQDTAACRDYVDSIPVSVPIRDEPAAAPAPYPDNHDVGHAASISTIGSFEPLERVEAASIPDESGGRAWYRLSVTQDRTSCTESAPRSVDSLQGRDGAAVVSPHSVELPSVPSEPQPSPTPEPELAREPADAAEAGSR